MNRRIALVLAMSCGWLLAGAARADVTLTGAGATFPKPLYDKWSAEYNRQHPEVRINYQGIGSGGGIKQITEKTVDVGATDGPMSDKQLEKAPGILHIPMTLGAVVPVYNLPQVDAAKPLIFSGEVLAELYLGKITKWNDPKLAKLNPGVHLPDRAVTIVHRSDGSGTTYIFADYLSVVNKEWATKVGKNTSVNWPTGVGGKGSEQVAAQVKHLPGAIGYVELAYATQNKLPVANLKNAAGNFVAPSPESVSQAMATATIPDDFRFSMVNAPGEGSYPIAGASWVLLYEKQGDAKKGKMLVNFLKWCVTEGQKTSPKLAYAPLPDEVQQRAVKLLETVK